MMHTDLRRFTMSWKLRQSRKLHRVLELARPSIIGLELRRPL